MLRDVIKPVISSVISDVLGSVSVLALFATGEIGLWFDTTDITTLYQDIAGAIPITAPGQTVALMKDKSGRNNHATQPTAAQRPTYGVIPYGGIRNLANGSGAVGDINYWTSTNTVNGVTATRIATGIDTDGLPYADFTISGTCTATSAIVLYANRNNSRFLTPTGTVCTSSVIARRISGPAQPFNCGVRAEAYGETSPGNTINEAYNGNLVDSATDTMSTVSPTLVNAATNQMSGQVTFRSELGATVNATYRVKGFQLEKAAARSAFQLNLSKYNVTEAGKASLGVLYPDGIDDWMVTPSINFSGTDKVTIWAGLQKMSDAARGILVELGPPTATGSFAINAPTGTGIASYGFSSTGTASSFANSVLFAAPIVSVLTGIGDISGDRATLQVNGSQVAQATTDQGTGNYSNNPIYLFRRGGASLPFNGPFTGLIVRGAASTPSQIKDGNTYINSKLGAY